MEHRDRRLWGKLGRERQRNRSLGSAIGKGE
jgi:hypothetical protein